MMEDSRLLDLLEVRENELLEFSTRSYAKRLEGLLHPNFEEFGCSGRVFDRDLVINHLAAEPGTTIHKTSNFKLTRLGKNSALVTYRIESFGPDGSQLRESLRSSTWVLESDSWTLRFHQGTKRA